MSGKIDLDRGVMMTSFNGVEVFMYVDDPGVYLNAYGTEVPESLAKQAGFDTEKYGKQHKRKVRMAAAQANIEAELAMIDEGKPQKVVKDLKGFKLVDIGLGRFYVKDPDDNVLTKEPVSRAMGDKLLVALSGEEEPDEKKPDDKKPASK